jgi:glycosyltransferase involved in cell wall biosynthesis
MTQIVFWSSIFFIFYAYLGYPLALMAISLSMNRPVRKRNITPRVSLIITAYNEEKQIREKVENTLKLGYPRGKLEVIVVSDNSTDRTDDIVRSYASYGIRLIRAEQRNGKEGAQKLAVEAATGEVLIFSDTATLLPADAISNIVKNFADPTVGCVSSVDWFIDPKGRTTGEGAYVRYEMFLRNLETKVNTLVGLSGSFFAARKEVCQNWAVDLQSDFNTLLHSVKKGLRGVSDPNSIGYYKNIADEKKEFDRKVRTVLRGITVLMRSLPMLNPFRYGLFAWQLLSHKLCRWFVPFAQILSFFSNAVLASQSVFYLYLFVFQLAFYGVALAGLLNSRISARSIIRIPVFLVLVNLSILNAWYRYAYGDRVTRWTPSER